MWPAGGCPITLAAIRMPITGNLSAAKIDRDAVLETEAQDLGHRVNLEILTFGLCADTSVSQLVPTRTGMCP